MPSKKKQITAQETQTLLQVLATRFAKNMHRHKGMNWDSIQQLLLKHPTTLWSLNEMEQTGGQPDVITMPAMAASCCFADCAPESPTGRRSLCYDRQALESRKDYPPKDSVMDMAATMGISLLNELQYRHLQSFGPLDTKTSSWIATPEPIRQLGGALFGDYRYGQVFIYHNGAASYYAARGFRGCLFL
jgi:hypothetical protein